MRNLERENSAITAWDCRQILFVGTRSGLKFYSRVYLSQYPNQLETPHALKHASNQNVIVNLQPRCQQLNLYLAILPSDYIFCAIPSAHKITMTKNFLFLPNAHSPFHLSVLEAIFIKTLNPILCRQTEFVYITL